jgi:ATP-dependent Lon protease
MGIASVFDTTDFHVEAIDLLGNQIECEAGIALIVAVYSAIKKTPAMAGLIVLGDLSIQGNIKAVQSLAEPLRMVMENGARRALIPLDNKRNFLEVSGEIMRRSILSSSPIATAAAKALALV